MSKKKDRKKKERQKKSNEKKQRDAQRRRQADGPADVADNFPMDRQFNMDPEFDLFTGDSMGAALSGGFSGLSSGPSFGKSGKSGKTGPGGINLGDVDDTDGLDIDFDALEEAFNAMDIAGDNPDDPLNVPPKALRALGINPDEFAKLGMEDRFAILSSHPVLGPMFSMMGQENFLDSGDDDDRYAILAKADLLQKKLESASGFKKRLDVIRSYLATADANCTLVLHQVAGWAESPRDRVAYFELLVKKLREEMPSQFEPLSEDIDPDDDFDIVYDQGDYPGLHSLRLLGDSYMYNNQFKEALDTLETLLCNDPTDRFRSRESLAFVYIKTGDYAKAKKLLFQFDDNLAFSLYTKTLLAYQEEDSTSESRRALREAYEQNPHVATMLVQNANPQDHLPEDLSMYAVGGETEAALYLAAYLPVWKDMPGVIAWVRETLAITTDSKEVLRHRSAMQSDRMKQLLKEAADWPQIESLELVVDVFSEVDGAWSAIVFPLKNGEPEGMPEYETYNERPKPTELLGDLLHTMVRLEGADGRRGVRPQRVAVRLKTLSNSWTKRLKKLGIECQLGDDLRFSQLRDFYNEIREMSNRNIHVDDEFSVDEILETEQLFDARWQFQSIQLPTWLENSGEVVRPWLSIAVDMASEMVVATQMTTAPPTPQEIVQTLYSGMVSPMGGQPCRPRLVEVCSRDMDNTLRGPLDLVGVEVELVEQLKVADRVVETMLETFGEQEEPEGSLLDVTNITNEHLADYYQAAADYYTAKPWHRLPDTKYITIACKMPGQSEPETIYGVVMGGGGVTIGLALYEDLDELMKLYNCASEDQMEASVMLTGTSILFGEQFEIPIQELDAINDHGFPISGPDAYPLLLRLTPGHKMQLPELQELELATAALHAVPAFAKNELQRIKTVVSLTGGKYEMELAIIEP